jgi:hypothetical protein
MATNPKDMNPDGTTTVKIVKIINGTDVVCIIPTNKDTANSPLLTLDKPLEIKYVPQITNLGIKDYIALVKWAGYTQDQLVTIPKDKILTITNASDDMIRSYKKVVGEYHIVDKLHRREDNPRTRKLMDREIMSRLEQDELNNKLDDIIDEFTDIHDDDIKKKTIH